MGSYSKKLNTRIRNRGANEGYCAICGEFGKLSRDHVPPKGCNNLSDVHLRELVSREIKRDSTSQGGTHFKTICSTCNSEKLGLRYDPELIALSNDITSCVKAASNKLIVLPKVLRRTIKPQRITRSIVGHILAAAAVSKIDEPKKENPMDSDLKNYFLNEDIPFPSNVEIYYWVYPSRKQTVLKYFGKTSINSSSTIIGHTIKFLPLGFYFIWNKPIDYNLNLNNLLPEKNIGIDDKKTINIDLFQSIPLDFPERPNDDEVMLYNSGNTYTAVPK
jgi:hypothetical protein